MAKDGGDGVMTASELLFTRSQSGAELLEGLIGSATDSILAALYRLSNSRLASALNEAHRRGVSIRLCLNYNDHYEENRAAQMTLISYGIPFRLLGGRGGAGSKMHHKFAVFDRRVAATGSYNWTRESEDLNYENLVVLREPAMAAAFAREFEALWSEGKEAEPGSVG